MEQEEKLPFLIPNGHKEIEALVKIAGSMLEIEVGEVGKKWLRKLGNMPKAWGFTAGGLKAGSGGTGAGTEEDH